MVIQLTKIIMKLTHTLIFATALLGASIVSAGSKNPLKDCETVAAEAATLALADPSAAEDVTRKAVTDRPDCACGIVKEVIKSAGVENDSDAVVSIVKGAIDAAGDQVKIIAECAMVVSPDSSAAIINFIDTTYGRGTSSSLGLGGRSDFVKNTTGAGNNFVIPPAYGGGTPNDTPPSSDRPRGSTPSGNTPGGGGSGGGRRPPVGTPGNPNP